MCVRLSFVTPYYLSSDSETGSSSRTGLRLLGEIPIRHHRRKGMFSILCVRRGFILTSVQLDAGLRSFRTMASQVLRPKVGRDTPREAPIPDREPSITPGSMGNRTVQPGGFLNSQSETIMI